MTFPDSRFATRIDFNSRVSVLFVSADTENVMNKGPPDMAIARSVKRNILRILFMLRTCKWCSLSTVDYGPDPFDGSAVYPILTFHKKLISIHDPRIVRSIDLKGFFILSAALNQYST